MLNKNDVTTTSHYQKNWWKEAVAYQIYPRSFQDSNGSGIGDLNGITERLDYLKDLGIDVIWICPMFKSPNDDNGYDISDYQEIMAEFGTMEDFDRLLAAVHERGMKLILDLVVNHTSDEHPWFEESKSSKDSAKRDWYIWRDSEEPGVKPNNWESIFKGSVWEHEKTSDEYYMHLFSTKQPDLNWENKEVREAIYKMINWWLDKGIDGFRVDAISHMKKEPGLASMPNPDGLTNVPCWDKMMNVDGILDYIDEMCEKTFRKYDVMTVGEANGVSVAQADDWVGVDKQRFNMIFQFDHLALWDENPDVKLDVIKVKETFTRWQKGLENVGWNALFLENHDIPRIVSKWGDDEKYWFESATSLAVMYFLMQGTPFIYQGQEIGMTNTEFTSIDDFNCVGAKNQYAELHEKGMPEQEILHLLARTGRDNSRTPMQWDGSANAGFSSAKPWLKVNPNYKSINVAEQVKDSGSIHNFYRRMIALRKAEPALVYGDYDLILEDNEQIYAYTRTLGNEKIVIICNLSASLAMFECEKGIPDSQHLLLNNYAVTAHDQTNTFVLRPYETRIYRC
ncbi:alpha-glucosidase [Psychromonas marina]|uniref:Alpha-amylase n=1 Tax=Psychromonas marina TaxID=88364 RepID=A0ABQ6E2U4_9GAMM|nr:alpha-glucosidase [Psychromonas marina]GLS91645.1 alpha-glucosidase [Psychromonas marina]